MSLRKSTSTKNSVSTKDDSTVDGRLKDLEKEYASLQEKKITVAEEVVGLLKDLIRNTPGIEAVQWTQYTPYFNDGDECVFGVHDLSIKFSSELFANEDGTKDDEFDVDEDGFYHSWFIERLLESKKDVINYEQIDKIQAALKTMDSVHTQLQKMEAALQAKFGDHALVRVTAKHIDVMTYDHE